MASTKKSTKKKTGTASKATNKAPLPAAKKSKAGVKAPLKRPGPRSDLGAPVDGFFTKQPATLRPIVDELRKLIARAAPGAESSLKWGMPFYGIGGTMVCAIGAHKAHVNLILPGAPGTYADPDGLLTGEGKTGRHLKLASLDDLPRDQVRRWLDTAVANARKTK